MASCIFFPPCTSNNQSLTVTSTNICTVSWTMACIFSQCCLEEDGNMGNQILHGARLILKRCVMTPSFCTGCIAQSSDFPSLFLILKQRRSVYLESMPQNRSCLHHILNIEISNTDSILVAPQEAVWSKVKKTSSDVTRDRISFGLKICWRKFVGGAESDMSLSDQNCIRI